MMSLLGLLFEPLPFCLVCAFKLPKCADLRFPSFLGLPYSGGVPPF